jgi:hypothetical protein
MDRLRRQGKDRGRSSRQKQENTPLGRTCFRPCFLLLLLSFMVLVAAPSIAHANIFVQRQIVVASLPHLSNVSCTHAMIPETDQLIDLKAIKSQLFQLLNERCVHTMILHPPEIVDRQTHVSGPVLIGLTIDYRRVAFENRLTCKKPPKLDVVVELRGLVISAASYYPNGAR